MKIEGVIYQALPLIKVNPQKMILLKKKKRKHNAWSIITEQGAKEQEKEQDQGAGAGARSRSRSKEQ